MTRLSPVDLEPEPAATDAPKERARRVATRIHDWFRSRQGHVAVLLVLVLATLSGSMSIRQKDAADPSLRILEVTKGELSSKAEQALLNQMDPYAGRMALAHLPGVAQWTPAR